MDSNKKKKKKTEITDICKDLVPNILSWLPTETAVRVSYVFLRGEWRIDMKNLTRLKFYFDSEQLEDRFVRFVNDVLRLRGGNCKLQSFSLSINEEIDKEAVNAWIDYSLDNGVEKLNLMIHEIGRHFNLTPRVFVQETLVTLKLATNHGLISIHGDDVAHVVLPRLKTLRLDDILIGDDVMFVRLISSCPVLEELVMIDMKWQGWEDCLVASASLKRLKILWNTHVEMDEFNRSPQSVSFDTPNLLYLEYTDQIAGKYPVLNFGSLIEAKIRLEWRGEDEEEYEEEEQVFVGDNATEFIIGLRHVRKLYLSDNTIQVLHECKEILDFKNLTHLTIQSYKTLGWEAIPKLLGHCPHLETLVLEGLFHFATDECGPQGDDASRCLATSPVTLLEIYQDRRNYVEEEVIEDEARFVEQVSYFLMRMPHLQQVKIYGRTENTVNVLGEIATQLQKLEGKACRKVQISVLQA